MDHSAEIDFLAEALVNFQAEVKSIPKNATNPFFKSKYADLEAIVSAVQPILAVHGLAVSTLPCSVDGGPGLRTLLLHKSGQWLSDQTPLLVSKDDPQGQGAAITYMRRYGLSAILGLVTDDDDDGNAASQRSAATARGGQGGGGSHEPSSGATPSPDLATDKQTRAIYAICKARDLDQYEVCEGVLSKAVRDTRQLTKAEAGQVIDSLNETANA